MRTISSNLFLALSLIFLMLFADTAYSAVYYVASGGNDSNDGLSQDTPWQSLAKVNSMISSFPAGTQVLFRRGDKFTGTLTISKSGTAGNEMLFGSYGTGDLPVITGTTVLTGWTVHSGNIYVRNFTDTLGHLYANGKLMTIARFPNSRFLTTDFANSVVAFDDAELNQPSGYWNQSNCRIRTANWCYESRSVSSYTPGHVNLSSATQNYIYPKAGYYFDNKLFMLDTAGEYFYDKPAGKLYFYAPGGVDPNTITVEASVTKYGVYVTLNRSHIIIQDLKITRFRDNCVEVYTANYVRVQRCTIEYAGKLGMRINGGNHTLDNNLFEDNTGTALTGVFTNGQITNNSINRTALKPGYGEDTWGSHGIQFYTSNGTTCTNNVIDSTGYTGLLVSKNMLVKNNVVSNSCLILNDGGGIDIDDADGMQVLDNIVVNTYGNVESSYSNSRYGNGIYFGPNVTRNILIQGNTIANNSYAGINVDNKATSANNIIRYNTLFNNAYSQIVMTDYSATSYTASYNNIVKGNLLYALSFNSTCMEHQMFRSPNFSDYGTFDSNYYCNPYTEHFMRRSMVYGTYSTKYYRLPVWKSTFNEDLTSSSAGFVFDQYRVVDTLSSNMILNPRFQSNTVDWTTTPASGSTLIHSMNPVMDTGCMRIRWTGVGGVESMSSSNYLTLAKNNFYHLRFDYAGDRAGDLSVFGRPNAGASPFLFARRYLGAETYRKSHSFVFKPDTTETFARVTFGLVLPDTSAYIDNVYLYRVNAERIDSTLKNRIFYNPTNSVQVISLEGIPYKNPDGSPFTGGSVTLQPFTSRVLVNDEPIMSKKLSLNVLMEGFYNPVTNKLRSDTVKVILRNGSSPFNAVDSAVAVVDSSGRADLTFTKPVNGNSYYIVIRHRNSLETWSGNTFSFISNQAAYDFTDNISKAYGSNMMLSGSRYCIFSGDVTREGTIDATDVGLITNDASNYLTGYVSSDINGDLFVDGTDFVISDNNAGNYVSLVRP
ncbi:MAG: right-handed parallel beta-helix repeat-containing protein [Ignavibacteria bacterium]|nr:right-handed parallel beta-helix repeat-containing protein [Ignavibacteria bacterium]